MEFDDRYSQVQSPKYDCLLFDLDDTLYPLSCGLAESVLKNIQDFMIEKLGIEESKIPNLCDLLYKNYGTTLAGLRAIGYDFDYDEYHSFVHGRLPYEILNPDPVLRSHLLSLPIRKVIFTNADKVHALKALKRLGLEECFEGIICFETLNPTHKSAASDDEDDAEFFGTPRSCSANGSPEIFDIIGHFSQPDATSSGLPKTPVVCKPSESAIERALKIANIDPHRTLFFEDSVRNIQSGKRLGLDTVLVGKSQRVKGADYVVESIHNIREAIPELREVEKLANVNYSSGVTVSKMEFNDPYGQVQSPKYDCLLFDVDDTLYPLSCGLADAIFKNIQGFMVEKLGIEESKIADLCDLLYKNYGTTLAGLRAIGYDIDYDEYHSFVHGRLSYEILNPDPVLRGHLLSLPMRKVVFTNADKVHALKVLKRLGLEDIFEGIICFETLNPTHKRSCSASAEIFDIIGHFSQPDATSFGLPKTPVVCKPLESAIERALKIANIDPHKTLFFEDSVRNIQAGKRLGLDTVLVGKSQKVKGADYAIESIHNFREAIPELREVEKLAKVNYSSGVMVAETSVTA